MSCECLAKWKQMAHYALTQQQGASLDTSWSNFTTEWAQEHSGAWDVLCGNTSVIIPPFLTVHWFIWSQQFVSSAQNAKSRQSPSSENGVRLLNGALFMPDSSMRENLIILKTGAVEKLHRPTQPSARLWAAFIKKEKKTKQALQSVHSHRGRHRQAQFTANRKRCIYLRKKKDQMVLGKHCSNLVAFLIQVSIVTSLLTGKPLRIWL